MKRTAIYPGSFDPITNGHLDIIRRGRQLFDELIVAVSQNSQKSAYFSLEDRVRFIRQAVSGMTGVRIEQFTGLLAGYVRRKRAVAVVRGLRAVSDFEYEFQMAL